jgi:phosphopantothenoylcysteine decarboxylase/phosphopantothenate--cysteine ligase
MLPERITLLEGRHIILGVTGSIAAYKTVELASRLTQVGALVDVIMTDSAQHFVTAQTFEAVTGRRVYTNLWSSQDFSGMPNHIVHVGLGEGADLVLVAPATANTLAKMAAGMADDLLTITTLAADCPVLVAPAMDGNMYHHPATQANIDTLKSRGVIVIEPDEGRFASGLVGKGRLPNSNTLLGHMRRVLGSHHGRLSGQKVVITAGGTEEAIDPVRFLTNHSTGKQGHALAQAAIDVGAAVTLITTSDQPIPVGVSCIYVTTAREMLAALMEQIEDTDVLIMAAAVADYRPETTLPHKIKKADSLDEIRELRLARNPDILLEIKQYRATHNVPRVVVGFAAESENLVENARDKLHSKGLDLIIGNDITETDSGFGADDNRVLILDGGGGQQKVELATKARIAEVIIKRIGRILKRKKNS